MNVERGRERNTDSKERAEECSLQVQALGGVGKGVSPGNMCSSKV